MDVGSVAQHMEQVVPSNLNWDRANRYVLEDLGQGLFGCDLFFQSSSTQLIPQPPTSLTGAPSDRPLDIATDRSKAIKAAAPVKAAFSDTFFEFLRQITQQSTLPSRKHVLAHQGRLSNREFEKFLVPFAVFDKKNAGYLIPIDYQAPPEVTVACWEQFQNQTFTKEHLIFAAGLRPSSCNGASRAFKRAAIAGGKLALWVTADQSMTLDEATVKSLDRKFGDMPWGEFETLAKKEAAKAKTKKPTAGPSKRKIRRDSNVSGGSGDAESPPKKKKKKKSKDAKDTKEEVVKQKGVKGKGKAKADSDSDDVDKSSASDDSDSE
ncbi:hypothetical protein DFH07DRAFT_862787 [Mycena maculata]|uniref:Uncharacterized protein n=1 Tax=Mycena maculata TaxID=230809 RepID=A0AAD7HAR6_9AGAR|nr:hypothetical protein DFH07DRAFT_862787 [Mycena maculata]